MYKVTFVPVSITCGAKTPPLVTTETEIPRGLESNSKQTAPESERKLEKEARGRVTVSVEGGRRTLNKQNIWAIVAIPCK